MRKFKILLQNVFIDPEIFQNNYPPNMLITFHHLPSNQPREIHAGLPPLHHFTWIQPDSIIAWDIVPGKGNDGDFS